MSGAQASLLQEQLRDTLLLLERRVTMAEVAEAPGGRGIRVNDLEWRGERGEASEGGTQNLMLIDQRVDSGGEREGIEEAADEEERLSAKGEAVMR
jgi:hypothetical protein